uniref:Uncharacterized protein n=1 Tax=Anguilla anguilla TaxID=7936 RepID=A0A0E9RXR1_ANGAN
MTEVLLAQTINQLINRPIKHNKSVRRVYYVRVWGNVSD